MPRAEMTLAGRTVVLDVEAGSSRARVDIDGRRGSVLADKEARKTLARCLAADIVQRTDEAERVVFEHTDSFVSGMSTTSRAIVTLRSATEVEINAETIENDVNPHVGW